MNRHHLAALVAIPALLFAGCLFSSTPHGQPGPGDQPSAQEDVDQLNQLAADFDSRRADALGTEATELYSFKNYLYWLEFPGFDPVLHRLDHGSATRLTYGFSIGSADNRNYRANDTLVVNAENTGEFVIYRAYDASQSMSLVGQTSLPAPPEGIKWWAYAVSGQTVYIVTTGAVTTLLKWDPTQPAPTTLTTLESAGATIAEFIDFDVNGNTMIFIESGRLWQLDLAANQATFLGNKTEVAGDVSFGTDGVLFTAAQSGLTFFTYSTGELVNLSDKIQMNAFKINDTFNMAAYFVTDFSRYKNYVVYIGQEGVFAYDMVNDVITPILLQPDTADMRIDYRYPVTLEDGTLFVTGLMSTDGAVGADGPVYQVDLTTVLP